MPADVLDSMKAFSATGFWNQLAKISHAFYVIRHFVPFMLYCRPAVAGPRVYDFLKALKQNEAKDLAVGTAGFCWGGHFVTKFCWNEEQNKLENGTRATDCGFVAHPSFLTYPTDIENITLPYSCAACEHDPQMSPAQAKQTEEILRGKTAKSKDQGIEHEFVMYNGASHGFAVRADEKDTHEAECGKQAEVQAIKFFTRWFGNPPP